MGTMQAGQFTCGACGKIYQWKPQFAGHKLKCRCGHVIDAPVADPPAPIAPAAPEPPPEEDLYGLAPPLDDALYGLAPTEEQTRVASAAPMTGRSCPACGAPLPPGAVQCVSCGYNVQAGQVIKPGAARPATIGGYVGTGRGLRQDTTAQEVLLRYRIWHWYVPIAVAVVGYGMAFFNLMYVRGVHSFGLVMVYIQVTTVIDLVLIAIGMLITIRLLDISVEPIRQAIIKLCAISLFPAAVAGLLQYKFGVSGAMIGWGLSLALTYGMFMLFFEFDLQETMVCSIIIWLVRNWIGFFIGLMILKGLLGGGPGGRIALGPGGLSNPAGGPAPGLGSPDAADDDSADGADGAATPSGRPSAGPPPWATQTFVELRQSHVTKLTTIGPSPQRASRGVLPKGDREVLYDSGDLKLKGWYAPPRTAGRHPALVFFHSGFAFGMYELAAPRPFIAADFAIFCPSFRGENGNPGHYELYYGELDDARAALRWIAEQPEVDGGHIYAFGCNEGGAIAARVSLYPDCGARLTGSAAGLYDQTAITRMNLTDIPFDTRDALELRLRVPAPSASQIKIPHFAYIGLGDVLAVHGQILAEAEAEKTGAPLTIVSVTDSHISTFETALRLFFQEVKKDLAAPAPTTEQGK